MNMKRKLVTSALPYVNNYPHLGNLIQVLSADVFARFCRLKGFETLYICGTDEYGTATETKAAEENKTPQELCDFYHAHHSEIYNWFNIAFNYFGRTSTPQQTEITQSIFNDLEKNGYITEHTIEQLYCPSCKRFLADRYVLGECPSCGYKDARGDQCEHCGKLLDPTELKTPRCSSCGEIPEVRKTTHLYINLPKIAPEYEKWLSAASKEGNWSNNSIQISRGWLREGLQERAITRDLKWGIPVPKKGFENKVFYVWFDAPIGYISITKCWADLTGSDWKTWWLDQNDVELFQFIGKDNIPFHTVIFPCSLIGSAKNWTKLFHMSGSEYLNYENGKFSKSKGVGVFGNDAKESGIPADIWRFYIFYNRPEKNDTQFTWKDFQERVNSELIGNLCNLVNRTATFVSRYYDGKIPEALNIQQETSDGTLKTREDIKNIISHLRNEAEKSFKKITRLSDWANLRDAFHEVFNLSSVANKAFQDGEPWKTRETDPQFAGALISELCYLIKDLLILIHPFMPQYADKAAGFFGIKIWSGNIFDEKAPEFKKPCGDFLSWKNLGERTGLKIVENPVIIFKTLENKIIDAYREKYSGNQRTRKMDEKETVNTEKQIEPQTEKIPASQIFSKKIALKTARIVAIEKHPDADKLYIEKLDDGSGTERTILSGLVPFLTEDELLGKTVIIADNLKPRKMRGIESFGMLLAASWFDEEKKEHVEILQAPWAAPGTPVILEGDVTDPENTEDVSAFYAQKPESIDADTFFSAPILIEDYIPQIEGKKLLAAGRELKLENVKTGEAG
ncbi:methionyl-tRNA synthetase [Treponema pedis str. T A4]|uniref:Methionine--tRNA ligase n=3 Tax=Treponema pedis TaxID=409322 RepID=S5ZL14_9SPIR|nr:methionyl-tRNA synthetase [Treponema pedis str. T A4]